MNKLRAVTLNVPICVLYLNEHYVCTSMYVVATHWQQLKWFHFIITTHERRKRKREKSPQFYIRMFIFMWIIYKVRWNRVENEEIDRGIKMHTRVAIAVKFCKQKGSFDVSIDSVCTKALLSSACFLYSGMPVCLLFWFSMHGIVRFFLTCFSLCFFLFVLYLQTSWMMAY